MKIIMSDPTKYAQLLYKAYTTTSSSFFVGSVVSLSFIQSFSCLINHISLSIFSLPKDCPDSKIIGITHDFKRLLPFRSSHYRCSGQVGYELFEALLTSFIPCKLSILF